MENVRKNECELASVAIHKRTAGDAHLQVVKSTSKRGPGRIRRGVERLTRVTVEVRGIWRANWLTAQILFDMQPVGTLARIAIGLGGVGGSVLTWWGSGYLIQALSHGGLGLDLIIGASAQVLGLAILGVIPVALGSLERMSDNATFEHVFGKYARKMISFSQEQLSDPELAERCKHVKERVVWRMMSMGRIQPQVMRNGAMLMVASGIIIWHAPMVLLGMLGFGLPAMWVEVQHAKKRADTEEQLAPVWGSSWSDLYQLMVAQSLSILHHFGAAKWFAQRYRHVLRGASQEECGVEIAAAVKRVTGAILVSVGLGLGLGYLIHLTSVKDLTLGQFVLVSGALANLAAGLGEFASLLGQQWTQARSIDSFVALLREPSAGEVSIRVQPIAEEYADTSATHTHLDAAWVGETSVEFDDVWLRYRGAPEESYALRGMSFSIPQGSIVAVVGANGAGKSSTFAVLLGQFLPTKGRVLIGGAATTEMSAKELSRSVVMLSQKIQHFNLTIRELLNLGRPEDPASDTELLAEIARVGLTEFLNGCRNGLATILGVERRDAVEPSGGQLQRLLLAAVALAERKVIVLDEPVSQVDPNAAREFWNAMFARIQDKTLIFSTHHLGVVKRAHIILFIEGGAIAAQGTHAELMERCEAYRRLYDAQADDYR